MIEPARISGTALIEGNTDVAIARDDRSSESASNAARSQYVMAGFLGALTLLGGVAYVGSKVEEAFVKF